MKELYSMNPANFVTKLKEHNIHLTAFQEEQFARYFHTLVKWNEKMNLTGLTEKSDVYLKHFYDSISLSFFIEMKEYNQSVMLEPVLDSRVYLLKFVFPI